MILTSLALPVEMRALLSIVGDHVECRCGYVFQAHASFLHCREHARDCYAKGLPAADTQGTQAGQGRKGRWGMP